MKKNKKIKLFRGFSYIKLISIIIFIIYLLPVFYLFNLNLSAIGEIIYSLLFPYKLVDPLGLYIYFALFICIFIIPTIFIALFSSRVITGFIFEKRLINEKKSPLQLFVAIMLIFILCFVSIYFHNKRNIATQEQYLKGIALSQEKNRAIKNTRSMFDKSGDYYYSTSAEFSVDRNTYKRDVDADELVFSTTYNKKSIVMNQWNTKDEVLTETTHNAYIIKPTIVNYGDLEFRIIDRVRYTIYTLTNKNHNLEILVDNTVPVNSVNEFMNSLVELPALEIPLININVCYYASNCEEVNIPAENN